jgi:transcriptional regulator with PAS, ATPase and Fis domain
MKRVFAVMDRIAPSDLPVLITGESGTGKELVARALYAEGPRREKPFVTVNCAAVPEGLLESELFGHVRGAFTGADRDRPGLFRAADGGTLFLDEVGDMGPAMQVKLLRALQDGEIRKVGGQDAERVNVRIVAATNHDPAELIREGKFREDLYYRLNVISILLPPLRERREDIPQLVDRFLADLPAHPSGAPWRVEPEALALLLGYPWPGNVRELQATVRNAAVFASGPVIGVRDLVQKPELVRGAMRATSDMAGRRIEDLEMEAIRRTLEMTGGNKRRAAQILGIDRKTLYNKLRQAKVRPLDD